MRMRRKIGYAAGDMGVSLSYFAVGFFFMYYLSDIVGMDPLLAGMAVFIGKLWDGVNDPLMGVISDRTKSRFGRKRVYILFGAMPFALSFIMLWMLPSAASEWLQFILATISVLVYATAYSVVVVPYMAMVPVMTVNYDERTQITGLRAILSTIGTILGGSAALLVSGFSEQTLGLRVMAISFAVFTALCLLLAARSVKGIESKTSPEAAIVGVGLPQYLALLREANVSILLLFKFLGAIATGCLTAALPYFAEHVLGDAGDSTFGLAIYIAASAAFIPMWNRFTHSFDKRRLLLASNIMVAAVLLPIGLLMQEGSTIPFFLGCGLLGSVASAYLLIPYSLVPDLVDFYEHKTGERHESVFFGLWMTVHQLGLAAAGLILGTLLDLSGYLGTAAVQAATAIWAVRLAFGLIPGAFLVLAGLVLQRYGITRKVYLTITAELEQGRLSRGAAGPA